MIDRHDRYKIACCFCLYALFDTGYIKLKHVLRILKLIWDTILVAQKIRPLEKGGTQEWNIANFLVLIAISSITNTSQSVSVHR